MPVLPHGGVLVNRVLSGSARQEAMDRATLLPSVRLQADELADLELLAVGAYSPLTGFMGPADYQGVVREMRLANGLVWSLPITLAVTAAEADCLQEGQEIALRSQDGTLYGLLQLQSKYSYDREMQAQLVYRTTDTAHPGVNRLMHRGEILLGGDIWLVNRPVPAFPTFHLDPAETRARMAQLGWQKVVGFQTRNPVHRAHEYIQKCALEMVDGLLLHPLVGATKEDDIPAEIRMHSYQVLLDAYYPRERVMLAVLPAAMRYAGPREAVFHALVRKNYGCTHFIVGRDHAGVGNYYGSYDAQHIFHEFTQADLDITPLFFEHTFYCTKCGNLASSKTCPHPPADHLVLSGTRVRQMLQAGEFPPPELTRLEVARVLIEGYRQRVPFET